MSDKCWLAAVESKPARLAIELFTPWEETLPDDSSLSALTHQHVFDEGNLAGEKGTRLVMWITLAMMVAEIIAGWWFNSMALLADGWHMSSHAVAIGLSAFAYAAARRFARDPRFSFGAWKIEVLAGFASAIFLIAVAALMIGASIERLFSPEPIHYLEAIVVAVVGLLVNIVCALILNGAHEHGHHHDHAHAHGHAHSQHDHPHHAHTHAQHPHEHAHAPHGHPHHDLNLRSAYLHVVADAATSVLAILALLGGMFQGWNWLDPVMGLIGAALVGRWAHGLILETSQILLDREMDHPVVEEIRQAINENPWPTPPQITDLHVWRVGRSKFAVILSLLTDDAAITPNAVRQVLSQHEELAHVSVEINHAGKFLANTLQPPIDRIAS